MASSLAGRSARASTKNAIDPVVHSTLAAVAADPELADNLSAAAHLIHGSSEGRFRIVYCTDPAAGGLSQAEVEGAGFAWRSLADELGRLQVDGSTPTGERVDLDDQSFYFVANPALGLWSTADRLGGS